MTGPDRYAGSARGWADGATLVYGPLAQVLVDTIPHPVAGRTVLDVGAGTGVASQVLRDRGARVLAVDRSPDMLGWEARSRPPAAVADVYRLPLPRAAVDDVVAAFVLNHLTDPEAGLVELARVTRPGGSVVACVFGTAGSSEVRDLVDEGAMAEGWSVPAWYLELKRSVIPLLGTAVAMASTARSAGLAGVRSAERSVDVGVETAEQLVAYRLGQAQFAPWLGELGGRRAAEVRQRLADRIRPVMTPYRPLVVFLSALVPGRGVEDSLDQGSA